MAGPFETIGLRLIAAAGDGMENFAAMVMADAMEQVPRDTGTLARSAAINHTTTDGFTLHTEFGFGYGDEINPKTLRPASDYAVPVHERVEVRHDPPTKAKYLEDPLLWNANMMGPVMYESMKNALTFRVVPLVGINASGVFQIIGHTRLGQPILRTPKGPRFGRRPH